MPRPVHRRALRVAGLALPALAAATLLAAPPASAAQPTGGAVQRALVRATLVPRTTVLPLKVAPSARPAAGAAAARAAATPPLATFTGSFTTAKKTYRYRMVGSAPTGAARTTKIPNTLLPVRVTFADKWSSVPSARLLATIRGSALYTAQTFPGGKGQYGDVYLRTQFWPAIAKGRKAWHVLMAKPVTRATLALTVPADKGGVVSVGGKRVRAVDVTWFDGQVQRSARAGATNALTQLVVSGVLLCGSYTPDNPTDCSIGGYHSAVRTEAGLHSYSYQSYLSATLFGTASGFYGTAPMSHELAEWLTDPYVDNVVPKWSVADQPQYGCGSVLEVGDPLVGRVKIVAGQPYQDEAYLSYFSRAKPSPSWGARYSWFGTLKTYSKSC